MASQTGSDRSRRKVLGNYEILGLLGRGGMGAVYRARHRVLGRDCALKVMIAGQDAPPELIQRFLVEARAVARMGRHPNIIHVHDVGCVGSHHYYAMDLLPGGALTDHLRKGTLPFEQRLGVIAKIARAVQAAHQAGILHRDIKPDNILFDSNGQPVLTDFGLARDVDSSVKLTRTGAIMGTPAYMSPEQAEGRTREIGPATDVWALGVILYQAITERCPFDATTLTRLVFQIVNHEPEKPSLVVASIPPALDCICRQAMRKRPERRYATAAAFASDLEAFLEGRSIEAAPSARARVATSRPARWRNLLPLAAAIAVGLAGLYGLLQLTGFSITSGTTSSPKMVAVDRPEFESQLKGIEAGLASLWERFGEGSLHVAQLHELKQRATEAQQELELLSACYSHCDWYGDVRSRMEKTLASSLLLQRRIPLGSAKRPTRVAEHSETRTPEPPAAERPTPEPPTAETPAPEAPGPEGKGSRERAEFETQAKTIETALSTLWDCFRKGIGSMEQAREIKQGAIEAQQQAERLGERYSSQDWYQEVQARLDKVRSSALQLQQRIHLGDMEEPSPDSD